MKKIITAIGLDLVISGASAQIQKTNGYIEIGGIYTRYQETSGWFTSAVGNAKLGVNITDNLSLETIVGTSVYDTSFYAGRTLVSARIDSLFGGYLKGKVPISPNADIFARVGFAQGQVSASTSYGSALGSGTGLSYGGGLQFKLDNASYLAVDYMSYYNRYGTSVTGLGLNYGFNF
jgi:outer membrane immunogenic protein